MSTIHYRLAENVLGLTTNAAHLRWPLGVPAEQATAADVAKCRVHVAFEIDHNLPPESNEPSSMAYDRFHGAPAADRISFCRPLGFSGTARLIAEGLLSGRPRLVVNRRFHRDRRPLGSDLYSSMSLLTDLAACALLRENVAALCCSAFAINDRRVLLFAPPGTQTAAVALHACQMHGAQLIASQLVLTDGRRIHGLPPSPLQLGRDTGWISRLTPWRRSRDGQIAEALANRPHTPNGGELATHIVILESDAQTKLRDENRQTAKQKTLNLNRYTLRDLTSPLLLAYEYLNPLLDLQRLRRTESEILTNLISGCDHVWILNARRPEDGSDRLMAQLRPESDRQAA